MNEPHKTVLWRFSGWGGVVFGIQAVLLSLILLQQRTWLLGGPRIMYREPGEIGWVVRSMAWNWEITLLLLIPLVCCGWLVIRVETVSERWLAVFVIAWTALGFYWICLHLASSTMRGSWIEIGSGHPLVVSYDVFPWGASELEIRLRTDPVTHALVWAGIIQTWHCYVSSHSGLRWRRITLRDMAIGITLFCVAHGFWGLVHQPSYLTDPLPVIRTPAGNRVG